MWRNKDVIVLILSSLCLTQLTNKTALGISTLNRPIPTPGRFNPKHHLISHAPVSVYRVDDSVGLGRNYDGIGGLSGGGATSKLLINYKEPQRTEILDYLFKPKFGASLQILKVEIGGDDQSSDGSESSHMHSSDEENYNTGYEWWLMKEAKKRNPNIKLYGLAWSFPGWIGDGVSNPYANVTKLCRYLVNWVKGAKAHHNLTIDYLGIWNEKTINVTAIKALRARLDGEGYSGTQLVGGDDYMNDDISNAILRDPQVAKDVPIIGVHYPGTNSTKAALKTNKVLWSSEDYSTYNNNTGAGCWARILNQNYVNGLMTSTIAWNLIASYYDALAWRRNSLMTANEPWSGHYVLSGPLWVTAHTTQFADVGWAYLRHGHGVGHLRHGGSYVSLTSPSRRHLTLVIETFQHDHSVCVRPVLPPYTVAQYQQAAFEVAGAFLNITTVYLWSTALGFDGKPDTSVFKFEGKRQVVGGRIVVGLHWDTLITITTVSSGHHGTTPDIPPSQPFPVPYSDDFETYTVYSEPRNFAQQMGVFEVRRSPDADHNLVMQQVLTKAPLPWCGRGALQYPMNLIGNYAWSNVSASTDMQIPGGIISKPAAWAYIAVRVNHSPPDGQGFGCHSENATGLFLSVSPAEKVILLSADVRLAIILYRIEVLDVDYGKWFNLGATATGNTITAYYNKRKLFTHTITSHQPSHGFVAVGTSDFGVANFDNFLIK